jgi:hypothetical protein
MLFLSFYLLRETLTLLWYFRERLTQLVVLEHINNEVII